MATGSFSVVHDIEITPGAYVDITSALISCQPELAAPQLGPIRAVFGNIYEVDAVGTEGESLENGSFIVEWLSRLRPSLKNHGRFLWRSP